MLPLPMPWLKYVSLLLAVAGLGWSVFATTAGDTVLNRYYRQHAAFLDRCLKLLFMQPCGERIVAGQIGLTLCFLGAGIWLKVPYWYLGVILVAVGPTVYLWRLRGQHIRRLEEQTDALIMGLANGLKTVPSPSAALTDVAPLLPAPMRLEIERLLKEMRIGSTLEQGILNMSSRIKSPDLDAALSSVLIGLQVGGNLPTVLENTAATIREMNRLQGVVRTKTAETRAQLWVLALFPFVIVYAFRLLDPGYFQPLQTSFLGYIVTTISGILWIGALLMARKILQVDI